ncbi:MAG: hypothetical protein IVW55_16285 [Chloroflexi bacterium]|nr:hypothetical protein [Chloroflexota bacterium]
MSNRNDRPHAPSPDRARDARTQRPAATIRNAALPQSTPRRVGTMLPASRRTAAALPIDIHRAFAAASLALLLLVSIFAPLAPTPPDPAPFLTPRINGAGSIPGTLSGSALEETIFPYLTVIERNQGNLASTWPDASDVLHYDPTSLRARWAVLGQMYASTSGSLSTRLKDTGLEGNPSEDKLQGLESAYSQQLNDPTGTNAGRGENGLAAMVLLRALLRPPSVARTNMENNASQSLADTVLNQPSVWQFAYNWALSNFMQGNYAAAYEGMRAVSQKADADNNKLTPFWVGLAALRLGNTQEAIRNFNVAINAQVPSGATSTVATEYENARTLSEEALGDAQWAAGMPGQAYQTYLNLLLLNIDNPGLYTKWLNLGLQQHGYESMVADMELLIQANASMQQPRLHHDRARLLSFLGRQSEADAEYRQAISQGDSDAGLLISYGQSLESRGDHKGAIEQAQEAIRKLNMDPATSDLSSVAAAVSTTTTSLADRDAAQQLLDANLLRARAWGKQGDTTAVASLTAGFTQKAGQLPAAQGGILYLYAGYADEAAGMQDKAAASYSRAWDKLKSQAPGTPGRGAALAGLARTTALLQGKSANDGLALLASNGYDPKALKTSVATDLDAPDILYQAYLLLKDVGQPAQAADALRVASITRNLQDARAFSGVGRPIWQANGTLVPAYLALQSSDQARTVNGTGDPLALMRYRQASQLDPGLAAAANNLGVAYAQDGKSSFASKYLNAAGVSSATYALGNHNLAAFFYEQGLGSFFAAESAQGDAIKSVGPQSLQWGYNLRYDDRGPVPSPAAPAGDLLSRLPAVIILLLLLLHTLVGNDRLTNRMGLVPTRGVLGWLAQRLDSKVKTFTPGLVTPRSDMTALALAIVIPSVVGMFGLAWGAAHGSLAVWLVFLPVALLAALIAFGGNELAQYIAARRRYGVTLHHIWPLGIMLGILSIPLGFVYGWQNVTRVQPAPEAGDGATARRGVTGRQLRTGEELDLAYEAQIEAAADPDSDRAATLAAPRPTNITLGDTGLLGLSPAARILFAGLATNLVIGALFGLVYWLTGWPSMRLAMFASMLVLAFTSVSEPPADGWTLFRRNSPLWLGIFVLAALMVTLIAVGII